MRFLQHNYIKTILNYRYFSLKTIQTQYITHNRKLIFNSSSIKSLLKLDIISHWKDYCEISYSTEKYELSLSENLEENEICINVLKFHKYSKTENCIDKITILVPEYIDLNISSKELDLRLKDKIHGDTSIDCLSGSIVIDKLRGSNLVLQCGLADVTINKLLEGNSFISCKSLKGKMINGDNINVNAEGGMINIEAVYGESTNLYSTNHINVELCRGDITAHSLLGNVMVYGIDGSFKLTTDEGDIKLQLNKLYCDTSKHVLQVNDSNRTNSYALADKGKINAILDPELGASIYCRSDSSVISQSSKQKSSVTIISDAFIPYTTTTIPSTIKIEENKNNNIINDMNKNKSNNSNNLDTISTNNQVKDNSTVIKGIYENNILHGMLTGKSFAVKRPRFQQSSLYSGKIDLASAEDQWNSTIINRNDEANLDSFNNKNSNRNMTIENLIESNTTTTTTNIATIKNSNITSNKDSEEDIAYSTDITLIATGNIHVETMSWIQVIRNKYGFKDSLITTTTSTDNTTNNTSSNSNTILSFKPGRTASASLIAAEINAKNQ